MNIARYVKENKKWLVLYIAASIVISAAGSLAEAQTIEVAPGVNLSYTSVVVVIAIGATVSVIRVAQGYDKSLDNFDWIKFGQEVYRMLVIALPIAFAHAIWNKEPDVFDYFQLFWTIWGLSAAWNTAKKPSIPINATDEEIAALRKKAAGL